MTVSHTPPGMTLRYKFVELSLVTDESLESAVNEWVGQGWQLDRIHFVTNDSSRRPVMAFVAFVREEPMAEERMDEESDAPAAVREHEPWTPPEPVDLADPGEPGELEMG